MSKYIGERLWEGEMSGTQEVHQYWPAVIRTTRPPQLRPSKQKLGPIRDHPPATALPPQKHTAPSGSSQGWSLFLPELEAGTVRETPPASTALQLNCNHTRATRRGLRRGKEGRREEERQMETLAEEDRGARSLPNKDRYQLKEGWELDGITVC